MEDTLLYKQPLKLWWNWVWVWEWFSIRFFFSKNMGKCPWREL